MPPHKNKTSYIASSSYLRQGICFFIKKNDKLTELLAKIRISEVVFVQVHIKQLGVRDFVFWRETMNRSHTRRVLFLFL